MGAYGAENRAVYFFRLYIFFSSNTPKIPFALSWVDAPFNKLISQPLLPAMPNPSKNLIGELFDLDLIIRPVCVCYVKSHSILFRYNEVYDPVDIRLEVERGRLRGIAGRFTSRRGVYRRD